MEKQTISKQNLISYKTIKQVNQHNAKCDFLQDAQEKNHTKTKWKIYKLQEKIAQLEKQEYKVDIEIEEKIRRHGSSIQITATRESENKFFEDIVATAISLDTENYEQRRIYKKSNGTWIDIHTYCVQDENGKYLFDKTETEAIEIEVLQK